MSRRLLAPLVLLSQVLPALAQAEAFPTREAAIAALFPKQKFVEWTSTEGDWNGDGIRDLAMILNEVNGPVDRPTQIRLVVLAGVPGGEFAPLSASSNYCSAEKFYSLEAKGSSLFVMAVNKAEGEVLASNTLQFRFSKKLGDLELIGRENLWESGKEYGRSSVNYLAGTAIDYERVRGRLKAKKETRFAVSQPIRLNGFDCDQVAAW